MAEVEIWKKFGSIEVSNMGNLKTPKHKDGNYTGYVSTNSYKMISFRVENKTKSCSVHRIVAHLFNDVAVDDLRQVDHINGNRHDNRAENIRMVTNIENSHNRIEHRNGKFVGITFNKRYAKWLARISINGKRQHLGYFDTELEAHQAYMKALEEMKEEV